MLAYLKNAVSESYFDDAVQQALELQEQATALVCQRVALEVLRLTDQRGEHYALRHHVLCEFEYCVSEALIAPGTSTHFLFATQHDAFQAFVALQQDAFNAHPLS